MINRYSRELSVAASIVALSVVLAVRTPAYFGRENLLDMLLANIPVLIIAVGMTYVILTAQIDISVGSLFAVCGVAAGVFAKAGLPVPAVALAACLSGAALGALNGSLVAYWRVPSIVVTLAAMVALRDGLRWATQGAWVENLPPGFQWLGLSKVFYPAMVVLAAGGIAVVVAWGLRSLVAGRAIYAVGSNREAARLAGIDTRLVIFSVFTLNGALTGLAALVNSARFNQIPSNAGIGLEMKVIAAVVVGGAAITGGQGTISGTLLGVILLGAIGPALTFLGINAYWEKAIQGFVILTAIVSDASRVQTEAPGKRQHASRHAATRA
jgi:rhamnose transport system permease protein